MIVERIDPEEFLRHDLTARLHEGGRILVTLGQATQAANESIAALINAIGARSEHRPAVVVLQPEMVRALTRGGTGWRADRRRRRARRRLMRALERGVELGRRLSVRFECVLQCDVEGLVLEGTVQV